MGFVQLISYILISLDVHSFSATQATTINPAILERQRTMEENVARMQELFNKKQADAGLPPEQFSNLAHTFVYGASQKGTKPNQKTSQPQQDEPKANPAYEPDDVEMTNADDESDTEEDERNVLNTSSKVNLFCNS